MSAESYGGLIWGSKALRGNLSPPGVAPRGVKNHPYALKSIFFKISSQKLVSNQLNGHSHTLEISHAYGAQGAPGAPRGPRDPTGWPLRVVKMTPLSQKNTVF